MNIGKWLAGTLACSLSVPALADGARENLGFSAIPALHKAQPAVRWQRSSEQQADITCDGRPDRIALGRGRDGSVWIGVLPQGGRPVTQRFAVGDTTPASFCATLVRLQISPRDCAAAEGGRLPGCSEYPGCSAFSVIDEHCDALHFYWHVEGRTLLWWRR